MTASGRGTVRRALDSVFRPRSIAIVGASDRPGSRGAELLSNLRSIGYAGRLYAVNPSRPEVAGLTCYPSLREIPHVPEMVAVGVANDRVMDVVQAAVAIGSRALSIVGAGYAESSADGARLQASIADLCRAHDIALCGPNCLGVWSRLDHVAYWLAEGSDLPLSGMGLVIQSGALASSLMDPMERRGIAFDVIATIGNEAGLTSADYLAEMADDRRIRAIAVVIEGIRDADRFILALETARSNQKPVFVVKLGRSEAGQRAALAHTASVAGEHRVAIAVLDRAGAVVVDDLDVLIESLALASVHPVGLGERVLYATVSGAGAGLIADLVSSETRAAPSPMPEEVALAIGEIMPDVRVGNPLDVAMAGDQTGLFAQCMTIAAESSGIDGVAVALNVPFAIHPDGTRFYLEQVEALVAFRAQAKPAIAFTLTSGDIDPTVADAARRLGIPLLMGAREAVQAIATLGRRDTTRMVAPPPTPIEAGRKAGEVPPESDVVLDEVASMRVISSWGVATTEEVVVTTREAALEVAARIGYPVVLKIVGRGIVHKSDIGGVRTGLRSRQDVGAAFDGVAFDTRERGISLDGVVIQKAIEDAQELLIGIKRDSVFGLVIVLGWGGVYVEILRETVIRRVPIDRPAADAMIEELAGSAMLRGARGRAPADVDALAEALVAISNLAEAAGDRLEAIDVNPIMVRPAGFGAIAVDAMVEMRFASASDPFDA